MPKHEETIYDMLLGESIMLNEIAKKLKLNTTFKMAKNVLSFACASALKGRQKRNETNELLNATSMYMVRQNSLTFSEKMKI